LEYWQYHIKFVILGDQQRGDQGFYWDFAKKVAILREKGRFWDPKVAHYINLGNRGKWKELWHQTGIKVPSRTFSAKF